MKLSAILAPLIAAGVSGEVILATVKAFEDQQNDDLQKLAATDEDRRSKGRERWRKWKENKATNVSKREQTLANNSCGGDTRGDVKQNNLEIPNEEKKDDASKSRSDLSGFKAELAPILNQERIDGLVSVRRKKKAPLTPYAGRLLVKALKSCGDVNAAADEMIVRNWTSIKPEWLEARNSSRPTGPPQQTPLQRRQQAAIDAFARQGRPRGQQDDDEFTGNTIDLADRDYRSH